MHIFEDEIKQQVDPALYAEKIGFLELTLQPEAVKQEMRRIRGET